MHRFKVLVLALAVVLILFSLSVYGYVDNGESDDTENDTAGDESEEEWVEYTPEKEEVSVSINHTEDGVVAEVEIAFNDLGHRVKDWGNVSREDGVFSVGTEIERYTGGAAQAIKTVEHSYTLGGLEEGEYGFQFMAWNETVIDVQFSVPEG